MPLKLLHHKSYHPYKAENVERVRRDEAKARGEAEEADSRSLLADSEARLARLRKKSRKSNKNEAEQALEAQLSGKNKGKGKEDRESTDDLETGGGSRIIRPPGWKQRGARDGEAVNMGEFSSLATSSDNTTIDRMVDKSGHINFWADFEAGKPTTAATRDLEARLNSVISKEKEHPEELTRMYIAKRGEGDPKGWYASEDGKSEKERKEGVENTLERVYKDGEQKRLSDPLATMQAYLKRRNEILSGASAKASSTYAKNRVKERYITPASERGDLSPVITSLLAPRRRKGEIASPTVPLIQDRPRTSYPLPISSQSMAPELEARERVTSERARAAALLASRAKLASSSTPSSVSSTPRSDWNGTATGSGGFGYYNKEETREAMANRKKANDYRGEGFAQKRWDRREKEQRTSFYAR